MTEQELACHLKICGSQLDLWRISGLFPYFKLGKAVWFLMADVVQAVEWMRIG